MQNFTKQCAPVLTTGATNKTHWQCPFFAFLVLMAIFLPNALKAQVVVPFTQRTSIYSPEQTIYHIQGDFALIGNTNMTLQSYSNTANNGNNMRYVDIDGDASTVNSSSAELRFSTEHGANPECTNIIYAGLYWTGIDNTVRTTSSTIATYTNGGSFSGYSLTTSYSNSNNINTYTLTPLGGGETITFTVRTSSGDRYVRVKVGSGTATNLGYSRSGSTYTLSTPYLLSDGSSITKFGTGSSNSDRVVTVSTPAGLNGFNKVKFKFAGDSYQTITANSADIQYPTGGIYVGYAEVTDYVKQHGEGNYFVADIKTNSGTSLNDTYSGTGCFGGWGMVVIYENSKMKWRDITVFDGFANVDRSHGSVDVQFSGFKAVQVGNVKTRLGFMSAEGDAGIEGDAMAIQKLQTTTYSTIPNPRTSSTNNFFNSTILTGGNNRNPNLLNNSGVDIYMFELDNPNNTIITNEQTSTKLRFTSSQDKYEPFCLVIGVDAYIPDARVVDAVMESEGAQYDPIQDVWVTTPGQEVTFTMKVHNYDDEDIRNAEIRVPLPVTINYYSVEAEYSDGRTGSYYYDPTQGINGTAVWTLDYLPAGYPDSVWATFKLKCHVTEDCYVLAATNEDCLLKLIVNGTLSGTSVVNGVYFENEFIQGFQQSGTCQGATITEDLVVVVDRQEYLRTHCLGDYTTREIYYCVESSETVIPFGFVSQYYPLGTRFYNESRSIEYTSSTGFPQACWTQNLVAVAPSANGAGCISNLRVNKSTSTETPADPTFSATNVSYCLGQESSSLRNLVTSTNNLSSTYVVFYDIDPTTNPSAPGMFDFYPSTDSVGTQHYWAIQRSATNPCYESDPVNIYATVSQMIDISSTHESPSCQGTAVSYSADTAGGTWSYAVTVAPYVSVSADGKTITLLATAPAGNYNFTYQGPSGMHVAEPCDASSLTRTITHKIDPVTQGGSINPTPYSICNGSPIPELTLSGYSGHVERWEYRKEPSTTWTLIPNNTWRITQADIGELATGTYHFRAAVKSGECPEVFSEEAVLTVLNSPAPANPTASDPQYFCVGETYTLNPSGSNYRWYTSEIGGTPDATLRTGVMGTTWIQRYISNYDETTRCESQRVLVEARPKFAAGKIESTGQSICASSSAVPVTIGSATDAYLTAGYTGETIQYQWYSVVGTDTVAISGATSSTYTPTITAEGTYTYIRKAKSSGCTQWVKSQGAWTLNIGDPDATITSNSETNILCNDASITLRLQAGGSPLQYNYQWYKDGAAISGATASSYVATQPGSYAVKVTHRSSGCSATTANDDMIPITTDESAPTVPGDLTTTICSEAYLPTAYTTVPALEDGLGVSISDDRTPDASLTVSSADVTSGNTITRTYTITDGCGNSSTFKQTFTINAPSITLNAMSDVDICADGSATLTASAASSNGTVTYAWNPDATLNTTTGATVIASPTTEHAYTVNATATITAGGNTCTATDSKTVTVTVLSPSIILNNITAAPANICNGGTTTLSTSVYGSAVGTVTYQWYTGSGTSKEAISGATGTSYTTPALTSTTTYTVEATATLSSTGVSCTATSERSFTVSVPTAVAINAIVPVHVLCRGASTGSAKVNVSGGTPDYNYSWSNGAHTPDVNNLAAGTYTVTVTDTRGCDATGTVTITQPDTYIHITTLAGEDVTCNGAANGTAIVAAEGGTLTTGHDYRYTWSTGSHAIQITNLGPGTYTVTATDVNNCSATGSVTIEQPDPLKAYTTVSNVSCHGAANGGVNVNVTGGVAPYTYSWTSGGTPLTPDASGNLTGLSGGTYELVVTDHNGCTTEPITVTITEPEVLTITLAATPESCAGNDGQITATVLGGTPFTLGGLSPYVLYDWYLVNSATDSTKIAENVSSMNTLAAGKYTIVIKDANGCKALATQTITLDNPLAINTIITATPEICSGGSFSVVPKHGIDGSVPEGTLYCWEAPTSEHVTGMHGVACPGDASIHDEGLVYDGAAGTSVVVPYVVTATYGAICHNTVHVNVTVNVTVNGDMTITAPHYEICPTATKELTVTLGHLHNDYSIDWTFNNGSVTTQNHTVSETTPSLTVTIPDDNCHATYPYTVSVVDNMGCRNSVSGTVTVLIPSWSITTDDKTLQVSCPSEAVAPTIFPTVTDGCGNTLLPVSRGFDPATSEPVTCSGNVTYTYRYTACDGTYDDWNYTYQIKDETNPVLGDCSDLAQTLTSTNCTFVVPDFREGVMARATDNCTVADYVQSPVAGTVITSTQTVSVYVKDACGNESAHRTIQVVVPSTLNLAEVTAGHVNVDCKNNETGSLTVVATGGKPDYSYVLEDNISSTGVFEHLAAGRYTVKVKDANGCTADTEVEITEPENALSVSIPAPTPVCSGSTQTLTVNVSGGTPAYSYNWTEGDSETSVGGASTLTVNPATTTTYHVVVTDDHGCKAVDKKILTVYALPVVSISDMTVCPNEETVEMTATVTTETAAPYTYDWTSTLTVVPNLTNNSSSATNDVDVTIPASSCGRSYDVLVNLTDANGCKAKEDATITVKTLGTPVLALRSGLNATNNLGCNPDNIPTITAEDFTVSNDECNSGTIEVTTSGVQEDGCSRSIVYTAHYTNACGQTAAPVSVSYNWMQMSMPVISTGLSAENTMDCNWNQMTGAPVVTDFNVTDICAENPKVSLSKSDVTKDGCNRSMSWTASYTNTCGMTASKVISYEWISDETGPVIADIEPQDGVRANSCKYSIPDLSAIVMDNVTPGCSTPDFVAQNPVAGTIISQTNDDQYISVTVVVEDGCKNKAEKVIYIWIPAKVQTEISATASTVCKGNSSTISVTATQGALEPGHGSYTYAWNTTEISGTSGVVTPETTTTYTVTVTDENACTSEKSVTVAVNDPEVTLNALADQVICLNSDVNLTASVASHTGDVTYAWSPATGLSATTGATVTASPEETTTYTVVATATKLVNDLECTATDTKTVTVTVNPLVELNVSNPTQAVCQNTDITPIVITSDNANVTVGTLPAGLTYNSATHTISGTPTAAGTYTFTVTAISDQEANCDEKSQTCSITVYGLPAVSIADVEQLCPSAGSTEITGNITTATTPNYTYHWTAGAGLTLSGESTTAVDALNNTVTGSFSTTACNSEYDISMYVVDGHNCVSNTATNSLVVKDETTPTISASVTSIPASITGSCGYTIPNVLDLVTAADGCSTISSLTLTQSPAAGTSLTENTVVTITATDGCSHSNSTTITVKVPSVALSATATVASNVSCYGGNNGAITVSATGGTPAYQYKLNDGSYGTSASFTGLTEGEYAITVKDNNNCTTTVNASISQPTAPLNATVTTTNESCHDVNATATLSVSGGTPEIIAGNPTYYMIWQSEQTVVDVLRNLEKGDYTVTVKDANGCTLDVPFSILRDLPVELSDITYSAQICNGGSFSYNPSDDPHSDIPASTTYTWATPTAYIASTHTVTTGVTGLVAGTNQTTIHGENITNNTGESIVVEYVVTPTLGTCVADDITISVNIGVGMNDVVTMTVPNVSACPNETSKDVVGTLTNVVANHEVWWTFNGVNSTHTTATPTGTPNVSSNTYAADIEGLACGHDYTVTMHYKDNDDNCEISKSAVIAIAEPEWSAPANGSATVTCTTDAELEDVPTHTVLTSPCNLEIEPVFVSSTQSADTTITCKGQITYKYKYVGCNPTDIKYWTYTFNINNTTEKPVFATITPLEVACTNPNKDDVIDAWLNGVTATAGCSSSDITITNDYDASNLSTACEALTVTFTAKDACGNTTTTTSTITLTDTQAPTIDDIDVQNAIAAGDCQYEIPDLSTVVLAASHETCSSVTFVSQTPAAGTAYDQTGSAQNITVTAKVKDACGNEQTKDITVRIPKKVSVVASEDAAICEGSSTTLTATATSGNAGTITYAWTPASSLNVANASSVTATPHISASNVATETVTYTVTATDANGCTATDEVVVTINNPVVTLADIDNQTICKGQESATLTAVATGNGTLSYVWTANSTEQGTTATITKSPTATTTYTVSVTDNVAGCTASKSKMTTVTVNTLPTVTIAADDASLCEGQQTATITATAVAGTNPSLSYQWKKNGADMTGETSLTLTTDEVGSYNVVVTDGQGCTATASSPVVITFHDIPAVTLNDVDNVCPNIGSIEISANVTAPTSTDYTYTWSGDLTTSATTKSSDQLTGTTTATIPSDCGTSYTVTVTVVDGNGCTTTDDATVTVKTPATPVIARKSTTTPSGNLGCNPTVPVLTAANFTVTDECNASAEATVSASAITGTCEKSQTWTATYTNSCSADATPVTITYTWTADEVGPTIDAITAQDAVAQGDCKYMIPDLEALVLGNSHDGCTTDADLVFVSQSPAKTTSYNQLATAQTIHVTVKVKDACDNETSAVVDVVIPAKLTANATIAPAVICLNETSTMTATVANNVGAVTYAWTPNTGLDATNVATVHATPAVAGTYVYTVLATDANGCQASKDVTLSVNALPSVLVNSPSICLGQQTATLIATTSSDVVSYSWSNGRSTATIDVTPSVETDYTVTVTNVNGCKQSATGTVGIYDIPAASLATVPELCPEAGTQTLTGTVTTPTTAPYTFAWSSSDATNMPLASATQSVSTTVGTNTATIPNVCSGEYTVTLKVTDAHGCKAADATTTVTVADETTPTITPVVTSEQAVAAGACVYKVPDLTGSAYVTVADGCSTIDPLTVTQSPAAGAIISANTPVTLTVADGCGHTATTTINVTIPTAITSDVTLTASQCYNTSDGYITYSISGGHPTYTVTLNGAATGIHTSVAAGNDTFENLPDGAYSIQITDADGCTVTRTATVEQINTDLVIKAKSHTWTYDGFAHTEPGYTVTFGSETYTATSGNSVGLANGDVVTANIAGTITNVVESPRPNVVLDDYTITRAGEDITCYYHVVPQNGALNISANVMTMDCASLSQTKVYDGDPLQTIATSSVMSGTTIEYSIDEGAHWSTTAPSITNVSESPLNVRVRASNSNYETVFCEYTLTITKKNLVITVEDTKEYDSDPLVDDYTDGPSIITVDGLVDGDALISGEVTTDDSSVGDYSYDDGSSVITVPFETTNGIDNYDVTYIIEQKITPSDDIVLVCPSGTDVEKTYDATPIGTAATVSGEYSSDVIVVEYSLNEGLTWTTMVPTITDAGSQNVMVRATHPDYVTTTCNYTLVVNPRPVTLISDDLSKTYDGIALVNGTTPLAVESGWVTGQGASYTFTGSQLYVGSSANSFTYEALPGTNLSNYIITKTEGTLTVTANTNLITIIADSDEKVYDGTELTDPGYTYTPGVLAEGDVLVVVVTGSQTNVGTSSNVVTEYHVMHDGEDVTDNYTFAAPVNGTLTVTCKAVTITAASADYDYDGNVHSTDAVTVVGLVGSDQINAVVAGSIQFPSQSPVVNHIDSYTFTGVAEDNYCVTKVDGELTMSCTAQTVEITADSQNWKYDGADHTQNSYTVSINGGTAINVPVANAGVYTFPNGDVLTVTITGTVHDVTTTPVANAITAWTIMHGTEDLSACYNVTTVDGTLAVTCRNITLTSSSASKTYDGTALTKEEVTVTGDGFIAGEGVSFSNYASITNAGSTANTFDFAFNTGTSAGNYCVTVSEGVLTVKPLTGVVVVITEHSGEFNYDGNYHSVTGYDVTSINNTLYTSGDFIFVGPAADSTITEREIGTYDMDVVPADFENTNPNFENVTFVIMDGQMVIYPALTIVSTDVVDVTCNGDNDGQVTITITGGKPTTPYNYTYSITGPDNYAGSTNSPLTLTGLKPGHYSVTITDALSYTASTTFTVEEPDEVTAVITVPTSASDLCPNQTDYPTSVVAAGGRTPYTYIWSDDATNVNASSTVVAKGTGTDCDHEYMVSVRVEDINGCFAKQTKSFTVVDHTAPTFTRPADITLYKDASCNDDHLDLTVTGDVTDEADNCATGLEATFTDVNVTPTNACQGTTIIERTWHLVDNCGNAAADQVQTITVLDKIAPTFTAPADITIYKDASCGDQHLNLTVTGDVTDEADNCSTGINATYVDEDITPITACEGMKMFKRTWSLVDDCGNAAADQVQIITIEDTIRPTFTAPADITIYKDANCNDAHLDLSVTGDVTDEADNCSTGLNATYTDTDVTPTGACVGMKVYKRTWSLSDDCGNAAADQVQTITVLDTIRPTFTAPADITIYKDANCNDAHLDLSVTGDVTDEADNCSTGLEATYVDTDVTPSTACYGTVIIERKWMLTDNCGNKAADQVQTITVLDNISPVITDDNLNRELTSTNCVFTIPDLTGEVLAISTDNCSDATRLTATQDVAAGTTIVPGTSQTVVVTVTDDCGNYSTKDIVITTPDPLAASVDPAATTICYYDNAVLNALAKGGKPTYSYVWSTTETTQSITVAPTATTTYTVTVTDQNGCTATASSTVTVKPVALGMDDKSDYIRCNGDLFSVTPTGTLIPAGTQYVWTVDANANVIGQSEQSTPVDAPISQALTNNSNALQTVVYHVTPMTDGCAGDAFDITVEVEPTPVLTLDCPADITRTLEFGSCAMLIDPADLGTPTWAHSLGWTLISITNNAPADNMYPEGDNVITWTMTDECGNTTTCEQHVIIIFPTCPDAVDYEGNVYHGVRIDCDCWTQRNLESNKYSDGSDIPGVYNYYAAEYPNVAANVNTFGRLYDWPSAIRDGQDNGYGHVQGICPEGWYLPTAEKYESLNAHGADALKSPDYWLDGGGNNSTGFTSLPAGYYDGSINRYMNLMGEAYYWSTTQVNGNWTASAATVRYICNEVVEEDLHSGLGYSVRCIKEKDAEIAPEPVFECGTSTIEDIDGNTYNTVKIGDQCWMKENLKTTKYADGTTIPQGSTLSSTDSYWYYPDDNSDNKATYGLLYNWPAVMNGATSSDANPSGVQGICPTGWHVPSDAEWTQLTNYVSSQSEYQCDGNSNNIAKALASTTGWNTSSVTCAVGNDLTANNATGFSAVPAGYYYNSGYYSFGYYVNFWSATQYGSFSAYTRSLNTNYADLYPSNYFKHYGYSVRCLKD